MQGRTVGALGAVATLVAGGTLGVAAAQRAGAATEFALTSGLGDGVALIVGPMGTTLPNDTMMASADRIFLEPLGFTGETVPVSTPPSWAGGFYDWNTTMDQAVSNLVSDVHEQIASGDVSAADPLVIFGYSQGSAVAAAAMQQLEADGVPAEDLHFVLTGNPASAFGGFLNSFVPSLPDWLQGPTRQFLDWINLGDLTGLTTPDGPYQTDVYTLPGDGWSDWPADAWTNPSAALNAALGAFSTHLEYFGLTPEQIGDAVLAHTDGTTDYFTVPDSGLDLVSTLWNAAINVGDIPEWLAGI